MWGTRWGALCFLPNSSGLFFDECRGFYEVCWEDNARGRRAFSYEQVRASQQICKHGDESLYENTHPPRHRTSRTSGAQLSSQEGCSQKKTKVMSREAQSRVCNGCHPHRTPLSFRGKVCSCSYAQQHCGHPSQWQDCQKTFFGKRRGGGRLSWETFLITYREV